jgi:adenine phosphoribosyltransferase
VDFKERIRVIMDFPEQGIRFKDITTLLKDGNAFHQAIDAIAQPFQDQEIDLVVGPEARGFVVGAPVAYALGVGFVPVRKPGKLPGKTLHHQYSLEYGKDALEVHYDAILPGQRVLIVDDLLATGGTTQAVIQMVENLGGEIAGLAFMIELTYLNGRELLNHHQIFSLIKY